MHPKISPTPGISTMPYAIDVEVSNKGRRFAATKRRVKFSFGFGNAKAIAEGRSSAECRGEEHEVVLVWSLTSGKQRVLADGVEVHFSRQAVTEKFECKWNMKSGHQICVTSAWAPLNKDVRHFDLKIDGLSYWEMPKIFQLGQGGDPMCLPTRRHSTADLTSLAVESRGTNTRSSHHSRPVLVTRAMSAPLDAASDSSTSHHSNMSNNAGHSMHGTLRQSQSYSLLDSSWHTSSASLPQHLEMQHSSSSNILLSPAAGASNYINMQSNAITDAYHKPPRDVALQRLVDLEPANYPSMSRNTSVSDLSVQSALEYRNNDLSSNNFSWNQPQTMFVPPYGNQRQPVYTFAS